MEIKKICENNGEIKQFLQIKCLRMSSGHNFIGELC